MNLTIKRIQNEKRKGRYADGNGLYLQVARSGAKSWIFRYKRNKKTYEMGLGGIDLYPLVEARRKAMDLKKLIADGLDPITESKKRKQAQFLNDARQITFASCAQQYIDSHKVAWKNEKHLTQWTNTLEQYIYPFIGELSIADIDTDLIIKCFQPIWTTKTETASRTRGRVERIFDWALARGFRTTPNPARWKGHLDKLLPSPMKIKRVEHFKAMSLDEMGAFCKRLRSEQGISSRALEFTILTAARTNEVLGAKWEELDIDQKIWTIPADRMKANNLHQVPLSPRAIEILLMLRAHRKSVYVFSGRRPNKPLSNMAMLKVLRKMKIKTTTHGFRSTFRDWAAEKTNFPREVAEAALAHTLGNKVELAYLRTTLFDRRAKMMNQWDKFCATETRRAEVLHLSKVSQ